MIKYGSDEPDESDQFMSDESDEPDEPDDTFSNLELTHPGKMTFISSGGITYIDREDYIKENKSIKNSADDIRRRLGLLR